MGEDRDRPDHGPQGTDPQPHSFGGTTQNTRCNRSLPAQYVSAERLTTYSSVKKPTSGMGNARHGAPEQMMGELLMAEDTPSAATGTKKSDAKIGPLDTSMNVQAAETHRIELSSAVLQRKHNPLTPLRAECWEEELRRTYLHAKYPQIPKYIQ